MTAYMGSGHPAESVAMEPLVGPSTSPLPVNRPYATGRGSSSWQSGVGRASGAGPDGVGVAAPPPAYADVAMGTPSAAAQPRYPMQPTTGSRPSTPPPPISAAPAAAPPAYHELFPSST